MNLIKRMRASLRHRSRRGIAALEFALTLPIWVTLMLGTIDGSYYLLVNEKTDRIAYTITDIATQYQLLTLVNLNDVVQAAEQLMKPYEFSKNGIVIVTSVWKPPGLNPIICWQYTGGGQLVKSSQIGNIGGAPKLPNGLTLNDNDNVLISEVYYTFTPLFVSDKMFGGGTIYRTGIYKPRLSLLTTVPS